MSLSFLDYNMSVNVPSNNAKYATFTLGENFVLSTFYSFLVICLIIYLVNKVYAIMQSSHTIRSNYEFLSCFPKQCGARVISSEPHLSVLHIHCQ